MNKSLTFIFILVALCAQGQDKETPIESQIDAVTVFLSGAQINRSANKTIQNGKQKLVFENISPFADEKSIQIKGKGLFTILSVNHRLNYSFERIKSANLDSLDQLIDKKRDEISLVLGKLDILEQSKKLLSTNMKLGGQNNGVTMNELKSALIFFEKELNSINNINIDLNNELVLLEDQLNNLMADKAQIKGDDKLPRKEIIVEVDAQEKTEAKFNLTYVVSNAGWFPKYDIRVDNINGPLSLNYKAEIYQNTDIPWVKVNLTLSNGNPSQSGLAPQLSAWNLNFERLTVYNNDRDKIRNVSGIVYDENRQGIPGVNVIVKGTTIGTITDINGRYSLTIPNNGSTLVFSFVGMTTQELPINRSAMNVSMKEQAMQLNEVVSTGLAGRVPGVSIKGRSSFRSEDKAERITTSIKQNQTTVEILADRPYTIRSNEDKLTIDLKQYELDANYRYVAVPKLDPDAFLIAEITNWNQLNLLEGEANLYFEDGYVGRSIVSANTLSDTLSLSLGRDRSIVVARNKNDEYTKKRNIGSNRIETRGIEIIVKNNKPEQVQLTVYDQLPKSVNDQITVIPKELSGAIRDEQTQELQWTFGLQSSEQKQLKLVYEVRYPKREKVILE